jgi:hypothetical protein
MQEYSSHVNQRLHWDLTKDFYGEFVPDQLARSIRYSKISISSTLGCIPKYISLERNNTDVYLELSKNKILLRHVIGDREAMVQSGPKIIVQLLLALRELQRENLVVQNIQPSTISVSHDFCSLVFNNIKCLSGVGKKQAKSDDHHPPYRCQLTDGTRYKDDAFMHKDHYSIGITLLEIYIGTDLIVPAVTECQLEKLFQDVAPYLEPATICLLKQLIFDDDPINIEAFIELSLDGEGESIR